MDDPANISAFSIGDLVRPGMKICEIGVRSGQSSEMFLEKGAFVYMIDPWEEYDGYVDPSHPVIPGMTVYEADYKKTLERVQRFDGKYEIIRKKSSDALNDIPNDLDIVYIDGNHSFEYVMKDMTDYWPKVKKGGFLMGDDWSMKDVWLAVGKFLYSIGNEDGVVDFHIFGRNWIILKI